MTCKKWEINYVYHKLPFMAHYKGEEVNLRHYFFDDPSLYRLFVDENRREVFFDIVFNFTVLKILNKIIS